MFTLSPWKQYFLRGQVRGCTTALSVGPTLMGRCATNILAVSPLLLPLRSALWAVWVLIKGLVLHAGKSLESFQADINVLSRWRTNSEISNAGPSSARSCSTGLGSSRLYAYSWPKCLNLHLHFLSPNISKVPWPSSRIFCTVAATLFLMHAEIRNWQFGLHYIVKCEQW